MLQGKNVVLGVTGGIAAYKAAELVSAMVKKGIGVYVIMTLSLIHISPPHSLSGIWRAKILCAQRGQGHHGLFAADGQP